MTKICIFYAETLKKRIDRVNFRNQVISATHWGYTTFYHKMRVGNIKEWETEKILPIIETFQFSRL